MGVKRVNPPGVAPPTGSYSLVSVAPSTDPLVWISGQVGRDIEGTLADGTRQQTLRAFRNLEAILDGLGLSPLNVLAMRSYLVGRSALAEFRGARDEVIAEWFEGEPPPANTLLIVSGLADPAATVEIEAVASGSVPG